MILLRHYEPRPEGGTKPACRQAGQSLFRDRFVVPSRHFCGGRLLAMTMLFFGFPSGLYAQTTVIGRVVFEGEPPLPELIEVKSDVSTCGTQKEVHRLLLGAEGGVQNAVVTIVDAEGTLGEQKGILDQKDCEFAPHVQALPVGSTLQITSSDPVLHNAHGFYEDGSTAFNIAVPIVGMQMPVKLKNPGVIKLRCDAGHTWMSAYVVATKSPYHAVTDKDGNFTLEGLPQGNYEIEVWHEWLDRKRQTIEIKEDNPPLTIVLEKNGT